MFYAPIRQYNEETIARLKPLITTLTLQEKLSGWNNDAYRTVLEFLVDGPASGDAAEVTSQQDQTCFDSLLIVESIWSLREMFNNVCLVSVVDRLPCVGTWHTLHVRRV
jgi:hypothetical protein